jgi:hypothetical protein
MVACNLVGGLGNYLFQIAASYALALRNDDKVIYDEQKAYSPHNKLSFYKNNIFRKIPFGRTNFESIYTEPFFNYDPIIYKKNLLLSGYFQSEKYFISERKQILDLFSIDEHSMDFIRQKYKKIDFQKTCSLHVRRGDYLLYPNIHPTCSLSYYNSALQMIDSENLIVFSDDITWCVENINIKDKKVYFATENNDYIDLWLTSLCKNNIIANSSFSWWGAWLNINENKKIISPKKWFGSAVSHNTEDLIPKEWIKI